MIGDTFKTKHFGTYIEHRENETPAREFVGKVCVREFNGRTAAFLLVNKPNGKVWSYDLPGFMQRFDKHLVAVLGRPYKKQVGDKIYHKLVLISTKILN